MTEEESLLSYLFPLLRYHSRWNELKGRTCAISPTGTLCPTAAI